MKRRLVLSVIAASAAPATAFAGLVDWYNGVKLGLKLPPYETEFLNHPPPAGARITIIDFWATWCAPCRESIPHLNRVYAKYREQGLSVVGLTQERAEVARAFLTKVPMHYAVGAGDKMPLQKALDIRALPYAVVVDRSNTIVWRGQPEEIDAATVEELLKNAV